MELIPDSQYWIRFFRIPRPNPSHFIQFCLAWWSDTLNCFNGKKWFGMSNTEEAGGYHKCQYEQRQLTLFTPPRLALQIGLNSTALTSIQWTTLPTCHLHVTSRALPHSTRLVTRKKLSDFNSKPLSVQLQKRYHMFFCFVFFICFPFLYFYKQWKEI